MNSTQEHHLTIPLNPTAHQIALKFAGEQDNPAKGKQVYLNTLAVLAVRDFLSEISFETDLDSGDSWNPAVRCFHDVADLVIPELGKVECRPILANETTLTLPQEVRENRIAYIVVRFSEQLQEVQLLGFVPATHLERALTILEIDEVEGSPSLLQPIEELIDYLFSLELGNDFLNSDDPVAIAVREKERLRSRTQIIAELKQIFKDVEPFEQRAKAAEILRSERDSDLALTFRVSQDDPNQTLVNEDNLDLEDLAEDLLDKLAEIWGESRD